MFILLVCGASRMEGWKGFALPHPSAGGRVGNPGFPIPLRESLALSPSLTGVRAMRQA
jgi:hypothetical protein